MKTTDGKISFENIIITPLERWVNTDFDLDEDAIQALNQLAKDSNQSVDNVVNHILADFFAEHLELSKLNAETLLKTGEKCPCILLLENGKPIARVKRLSGAMEILCSLQKNPHPKNAAEKTNPNRSQIVTSFPGKQLKSLELQKQRNCFIFFD